jgi:hypothetical protein
MSQFKNSETHLNLKDSLDYMTLEESHTKLREYVSLLAHEGIMEIHGLDIEEIARGIRLRIINVYDLNEIMKGRQSFGTLESRCEELNQLGLEVTKKRISNYQYYIEAIRR